MPTFKVKYCNWANRWWIDGVMPSLRRGWHQFSHAQNTFYQIVFEYHT